MRTGFIDIFNNGSDFELNQSTGITETRTVINNVLIGLFGGNVEQSEPVFRGESEVLFSWWGNRYSKEFENPKTERLLVNITLSSATPAIVKRSVEDDLKFLSEFFDVDVQVFIPTVNRLNIDIELREKKTGRNSKMSYIWDTLTGELFDPNNNIPDLGGIFDYDLDFTL